MGKTPLARQPKENVINQHHLTPIEALPTFDY